MASRLAPLASALIGAAALMAALPAAADVVTISSRGFSAAGVNPGAFTTSADYVGGWNTVLAAEPTAPAGYGDYAVADWNGGQSNRSLGGTSATDLAFLYNVSFHVDAADAGTWSFRVAPDFGYGGTMLLDAAALDTKTTDLWWGGNWNATSQILTGSANVTAGWHTLKVYGFEGCCDGGTGGQYQKANAASFQDFTTNTNGAVPEPAAWALMITGFGLMGAALRRRRGVVAA